VVLVCAEVELRAKLLEDLLRVPARLIYVLKQRKGKVLLPRIMEIAML